MSKMTIIEHHHTVSATTATGGGVEDKRGKKQFSTLGRFEGSERKRQLNTRNHSWYKHSQKDSDTGQHQYPEILVEDDWENT